MPNMWNPEIFGQNDLALLLDKEKARIYPAQICRNI